SRRPFRDACFQEGIQAHVSVPALAAGAIVLLSDQLVVCVAERRAAMSKKRGPDASLATPVPGKPDKKSAPPEKSKRRFFGLVQRKEKWVLSWRGRFAVLAALMLFGFGFISWVHGFLAVTERVDTQYLVVEGWMPNYGLEESMAEFKSKPYKKIFTVGADP